MNLKQLANLDELKMMARGNPAKLADFVSKRNELDQLKADHFNEEHPFVNGFNESYLEELKQFAQDHPENESAQIRYSLQKERFAVQENSKTAHIDRRVALSELRQKLAVGEVTKADLLTAEKIARANGTPENLAIYSQIKNSISEGDVE
jgi:hypothetical protein